MHLSRLYYPRRRRLAALQHIERVARTSPHEVQIQSYSYLVMELHNLWVQYARAVFVHSCRGGTTESGRRVFVQSCKRKSSDEIVAYAAYVCGKVRTRMRAVSWSKEPKWFDLTELYKCFDGAGLPNKTSVDLVQGAGFKVFRELGLARNFAAHKNESLAVKLETDWGSFAPGAAELTHVLNSRDSVYPTVGARWITEMSDACELLTN